MTDKNEDIDLLRAVINVTVSLWLLGYRPAPPKHDPEHATVDKQQLADDVALLEAQPDWTVAVWRGFAWIDRAAATDRAVAAEPSDSSGAMTAQLRRIATVLERAAGVQEELAAPVDASGRRHLLRSPPCPDCGCLVRVEGGEVFGTGKTDGCPGCQAERPPLLGWGDLVDLGLAAFERKDRDRDKVLAEVIAQRGTTEPTTPEGAAVVATVIREGVVVSPAPVDVSPAPASTPPVSDGEPFFDLEEDLRWMDRVRAKHRKRKHGTEHPVLLEAEPSDYRTEDAGRAPVSPPCESPPAGAVCHIEHQPLKVMGRVNRIIGGGPCGRPAEGWARLCFGGDWVPACEQHATRLCGALPPGVEHVSPSYSPPSHVTITAGQLLRLRQLGPGDEVPPELLPAALVILGRAGYVSRAGAYSWTAQAGWEWVDDEPKEGGPDV